MEGIGTVELPNILQNLGGVDTGLGTLLNIFLNLLVVIAGIYALFNFVLAGYAFLGAGDDPKKIEGAWAKIYQSIIGLLFAAGSLIIAALVGAIIFGNATALINPVIPTQ